MICFIRVEREKKDRKIEIQVCKYASVRNWIRMMFSGLNYFISMCFKERLTNTKKGKQKKGGGEENGEKNAISHPIFIGAPLTSLDNRYRFPW